MTSVQDTAQRFGILLAAVEGWVRLIQQQGRPEVLYERPVNKFVANFIGVSNPLPARIQSFDPATRTARVESEQGLRLTGLVTDVVSERLGLRSVSVDPARGLFLNGRHLALHGVNRHQDRPGRGWAVTAADEAGDFDLMDEMDYGMVSADANGGGIPGGVGSGPDPSISYQTVYAGVDDVEGTLAKAESLGAKTVAPPMDLPAGGRIALFVDPQGHTFGLVKPPPDSDYIG